MTRLAGRKSSRWWKGFLAAGWICLLSVAAPCHASDSGKGTADSGLTCVEPVYRFGTLGPEKTVPHTFVLTNAGPQEVRISAVRAGCGCLTATLAANTVAPGRTVDLDAVMTLAGRKGPQRKLIYVEVNSNTLSPLRLEFEGTVVPPIEAQPEGVHFGTLAANGDVEREVTLSASGEGLFQIRSIACASTQFSATFETLEAGRRYVLRIRSVGPRNFGTTTASIRVETDHPAMPFLTVPVTVFVAGDVVAAPASLMLIESATNLSRTYYLSVYSPARKAFKILEVQAPREEVESRVEAVAADRYRVELRFPGRVRDLDGARIRIRTDVETQPEILVPLRVIARPVQ